MLIFRYFRSFPFRGRKVLRGGDCNNPDFPIRFKLFKTSILRKNLYFNQISSINLTIENLVVILLDISVEKFSLENTKEISSRFIRYYRLRAIT